MNNIENCRAELETRFPDRIIFVSGYARTYRFAGETTRKTEYDITLFPGFNYENCQIFSGDTLSECMEKVNKLAPQAPQRNEAIRQHAFVPALPVI